MSKYFSCYVNKDLIINKLLFTTIERVSLKIKYTVNYEEIQSYNFYSKYKIQYVLAS